MTTRAELKAERERGPTPGQIADARRIQFQRALVSSHAVLLSAQTAVVAVEAAGSLAVAQTAVAGQGAALGGAAGTIGNLLPV